MSAFCEPKTSNEPNKENRAYVTKKFFRHAKNPFSCYISFQIGICEQIIVKNCHWFRSTRPPKPP